MIETAIHKFDELALSILIFYSFIMGEQRIPDQNPYNWEIISTEGAYTEGAYYEASVYQSKLIIDHCKNHPEDQILFPSLSNAIQKAELDGIEIYSTGDVSKQIFGSSGYISCDVVKGGQSLGWKVYDFSRYFPYSHYPKVVETPDYINIFKNTLRPCCGFALVILAFFILGHFIRKISARIVWSLFLAGTLFGLNLIIEEANLFGINLSLLIRMKLIYIFTYVGESFFVYALLKKQKIHFAAANILYLSTFILVLGSLITKSPDTMQFLECQFLYIANLVVGFSILWKTIGNIIEKKNWKSVTSCSSALIFVGGSLWDHAYYLGLNHGPMLLPVALLFSLIFFSIHLFEDVQALYYEKEKIQKNAEEFKLLKNTNSAIVKTIMALAHDVRKPISMIEAFLPLLNKISSAKEMHAAIEKYAPTIKNASESIKNVLDNALYLGPDRPLKRIQTNIVTIFESAMHIAMSDRKSKNTKIIYIISSNPVVVADYYQMERVFINILSNALDIIGPNNFISLVIDSGLLSSGNFLKIKIKNSGSYIKNENLNKIFETFYSERFNGFGLGLSICKSIVQNHNGSIKCSSVKGDGTEFEILLPQEVDFVIDPFQRDSRSKYDYDFKICPVKSESVKKNHKSFQISKLESFVRINGRKIRVLHIDDEEIYCERVRNLINKSQLFDRLLEIHTINDMNLINENRNILQENLYDIVIMDRDLGFSDFDGLEILRHSGTRGTALLCLHSNRTTDSEIEDIKDIVDCILPKPVGEEEMLDLLFNFSRFGDNLDHRKIAKPAF